jgi:transposase
LRTLKARDLAGLLAEIAKAKQRFGLPDNAPVRCCYEAGRDGFWLHRWLEERGLSNVIVDASSIEVKRQRRRAKTDRLDASKLLTMLLRYHDGEGKVWSVVQVPSVSAEDRRRLHRELLTLKGERTEHVNRIKGLLATVGVTLKEVDAQFADRLPELRSATGQAVPMDLQAELRRAFGRWQLVQEQIAELELIRAERVYRGGTPQAEQVQQLLRLRAVGINSAWLLVLECLGWRRLKNRRQLGSLAGLTPTPYQSGDSCREQGISKAGNRRLRTMMVELSWCWLRFQPESALSQWYVRRFSKGTKRDKKVGVVALARKLLIALWKYLKDGEVPQGAVLTTDWEGKLGVAKKRLRCAAA